LLAILIENSVIGDITDHSFVLTHMGYTSGEVHQRRGSQRKVVPLSRAATQRKGRLEALKAIYSVTGLINCYSIAFENTDSGSNKALGTNDWNTRP
jgi:hypothetical protein